MSDTPRTDELSARGVEHYMMKDHARKLERELAKVRAENEVLREQNFAMNKTIARMRPVVIEGIKHFRREPNEMFDAVRDYESVGDYSSGHYSNTNTDPCPPRSPFYEPEENP